MYIYNFTGEATEDNKRNDINFDKVKDCYNYKYHHWTYNLLRYGHLKNMGWLYDFRDELKLFVYKQYDNVYEAYAPNKTLLRKAVGGKIDYIVEVK